MWASPHPFPRPNEELLAGLDNQYEGDVRKAVVDKPVIIKVDNSQAQTANPVPAQKGPRTKVVVVHNNMVPVPIECFQPPDSGICDKDMVRIYYDHETRTCKPFSYTGCRGNQNRFMSVKNCYRICHPYRYKVRPTVFRVSKSKAQTDNLYKKQQQQHHEQAFRSHLSDQ